MEIQLRVQEVKLEFYKLIRRAIIAYTDKDLLIDYKRANQQSRHMTNFMKWQHYNRDIFMIINKKNFKTQAKSLDGKLLYNQSFYSKLIYYPFMQNFILDKFFPNSVDDNIR